MLKLFLRCAQTRDCCIVVYWGQNSPNCVKMKDFATDWYWILVTNWDFGIYEQFAKNTLSCSVKRWPKVTNAKSLRETDEYCVIFISRRYKERGIVPIWAMPLKTFHHHFTLQVYVPPRPRRILYGWSRLVLGLQGYIHTLFHLCICLHKVLLCQKHCWRSALQQTLISPRPLQDGQGQSGQNFLVVPLYANTARFHTFGLVIV